MSAVEQLSKTIYTVEEYLALERETHEKHEFYKGELFAMAGGSPNHALICMNISSELHVRLSRKGCRAFNSELKIFIQPFDLYTYADASALCGKPNFLKETDAIIDNPSLIVEVLSDSTEDYDRSKKFLFYRALPSFNEYLLIRQEKPFVEYYAKLAEHKWLLTEVEGLSSTVRLKHLGISIPLAKIYANIQFAPTS
ncbi:MAG: Uma2 family endonuclease [Chloroherpetonaceae bacterium]